MRILNYQSPVPVGQTLGPDYLDGFWVTTPTGLRGARPEEIEAYQQDYLGNWQKKVRFRMALGLPV